jgi:hypothetical protein
VSLVVLFAAREFFADCFWARVAGGVCGFLLGVFNKMGGWWCVFCGQSVVNCVVKMVS